MMNLKKMSMLLLALVLGLSPVALAEEAQARARVLVAVFSRAGENYNVGVVNPDSPSAAYAGYVEKGNTQIMAEMIAEATGADLFLIAPATPYPEDYATMLQAARTEAAVDARPEMAEQLQNLEDYDVVFVGYPIWDGEMPQIMLTFLESCDFTGKTVVPFNTHAGSGVSGTDAVIRAKLPTATVLDGFALAGKTAQEQQDEAREAVGAWLSGLGIDLSAANGLDARVQMQGDCDAAAALAAQGEKNMNYDFSIFTNVEITGLDLSTLTQEQLAVLYQQARYCQAMTDADTDTMGEIVSGDMTFTHMSGMQQTREEYFADVRNGSLRYFTIGMENPAVKIEGDAAAVAYTSILNANAYGAQGTYRMGGTHYFERRDGEWIAINNPNR